VYAYHPSALVEAIGVVNSAKFDIELHAQAFVIGVLASKGFHVRGNLKADLEQTCIQLKLPIQLAFYHPSVTEAFLAYVPELDEVTLVDGNHPAMGEEVATYCAHELMTEWADLEPDEICCRMLVELGEEDEDELDSLMLRDLESCFPLTEDQQKKLGDIILEFMDEENDPDSDDEHDTDEDVGDTE
jgi:hypothetical protein